MKTETNEDVFVKVKDKAGNEFVCPLNELRDVKFVSDEELEAAKRYLTGAYPLVRVGRNIRLVAAQAPAD